MADHREDARSNVFLSAVMVADAQPRPVRVRNISAGGALVDGANLPPLSAIVQLVRGELSVCGKIAWLNRGYCGVRFETEVVVEDWVRRVEHSGQQRVDQIIAALKRPITGATPQADREQDSLGSISTDLAAICECLANIPDLVARYPNDLLKLDAIAQRLASLANGPVSN